MFSAFDVPISWWEIVQRTAAKANEDNILGLAAQLAYYFLLALVPALVFVVALTSFFPSGVLDALLNSAAGVVPSDMLSILRGQIDALREGEHGSLLSFGLVMAIWSSSASLVGVIDALNRAYDIDEGRPWWKARLTAMALTLGLALFVLTALTLVVAGPAIAESIASRVGLGSAFTMIWNIVQWPVVFALVVLAVALVNYFAPDADQDWVWISPGSLLATVLWLLVSLGFKLYVANFADYNATYGSLGAVIVLMLWFYISSVAILAGAEMNAVIEHASSHGKDPGEKTPGEKKQLGARAKRAWEARQRGQTGAAATQLRR